MANSTISYQVIEVTLSTPGTAVNFNAELANDYDTANGIALDVVGTSSALFSVKLNKDLRVNNQSLFPAGYPARFLVANGNQENRYVPIHETASGSKIDGSLVALPGPTFPFNVSIVIRLINEGK